MGNHKGYENYKDSGVNWLGEMPEHWEVSKIKYVSTINENVLPESTPEDYEIEYIDIGSVNSNGEIIKTDKVCFKDAPSRARRIVSGGDTIVSTVRTYLRAITSFEQIPSNVICSTGFAVLSPNCLVPKFLSYIMKSTPYIEEIVKRSVGVSYPAINASDIGSFEVFIPLMTEQQAIANFLDHKTSETDALIFDKEKLIELLKEQRQAIITEAVTKGLNSDVKMKDSGIEWIGEIPEHWRENKLKYQVDINKNKLSENTPDDYEINYIDISSVDTSGKVLNTEIMIFGEAPSRARRKLVKGDTIVSTVRTYLRAITWFEDPPHNLICSTGFAVLSPKASIYPKYLAYLMRSTKYIDEIVARSVGVSYPAINASDIGKLECFLPQLTEQKEIVRFIDDTIDRIDVTTDRLIVQIQKLKEYRQSLIYEAVTGKIDVRDWVDKPFERSDAVANT